MTALESLAVALMRADATSTFRRHIRKGNSSCFHLSKNGDNWVAVCPTIVEEGVRISRHRSLVRHLVVEGGYRKKDVVARRGRP